MTKRYRIPLLLTVLLAGCAASPPPSYYTLSLPPPRTTNDAAPIRISLAEVGLPAYARASQLASLVEPNRIELDDDHRWASAPSEALTTLLAAELENAAGASVLIRPHTRTFKPDFTIDIDVDRFHRATTGGANLSGRAVVVHAATGTVRVIRFAKTAPTTGTTYADYMVSVQTAVSALAAEIAAVTVAQ